MTNWRHSVLYTGVTNDLPRRVWQHRSGLDGGSFTARYNLRKLVFFEPYTSIVAAIGREKQIKGWARHKKMALITGANPEWRDLGESLSA